MCVGFVLSRMYLKKLYSHRQFVRIVETVDSHIRPQTTIVYVPLATNYQELEKMRDDTLTLNNFNVFLEDPIPEFEVDVLCKVWDPEHGVRHIKWDKTLKYSERKEEFIRTKAKTRFIDKLMEQKFPPGVLIDDEYMGKTTFVRLGYLNIVRTPSFMPRFVKENVYLRWEGNEHQLGHLLDDIDHDFPLKSVEMNLDKRYRYEDLDDEDVIVDKLIKYDEGIDAIIKEFQSDLVHETLVYANFFKYFE